jgi:hypothetical protein
VQAIHIKAAAKQEILAILNLTVSNDLPAVNILN